DSFFIKFIAICILIIGTTTLFPLFLEDGKKDFVVLALICSLIFILSDAFILWFITYIIYEFKEYFLYVKEGPFRIRITYEIITRVAPTHDNFTGYRLTTSIDGLEIIYKTAALVSVKVSPKEKEKFISELKKPIPHGTINL